MSTTVSTSGRVKAVVRINGQNFNRVVSGVYQDEYTGMFYGTIRHNTQTMNVSRKPRSRFWYPTV